MPKFQERTTFLGGLRGDGWATPEYYGAKGLSNVNDLTAFQTAVNDLTLTGGKLFLGPKSYRLDGLLTVPGNVSWQGVPDVTYVSWGHASANRMVFLDYNLGPPAVFSDIRFIGRIAGTGTCITNNADARVQFVRCSFNGNDSGGGTSSNLTGKLLTSNSSDSETDFIDCRLEVVGTLKGLDVLQGTARVIRGIMKMPATYSDTLFNVGSGAVAEMYGVDVDCTAHSSGSGVVFSTTPTSNLSVHGGNIHGADSTKTAFSMAAGGVIVVKGTQFSGISPYGGGTLGGGSWLDMRPFGESATGGSSYTLPSGYRNVVVDDTYVGNTVYTMPNGYFPGQELELTVNNHTVSAKQVSFTSVALTGTSVPLMTAGNTLTGLFVWERLTTVSAYRWVQKGTWGVGLTLA